MNWTILTCHMTSSAPQSKNAACANKKLSMLQVTSSLVVMSDKISACSVNVQQAYLCAVRVSVALPPHDQLTAKDADVTSLPN